MSVPYLMTKDLLSEGSRFLKNSFKEYEISKDEYIIKVGEIFIIFIILLTWITLTIFLKI